MLKSTQWFLGKINCYEMWGFMYVVKSVYAAISFISIRIRYQTHVGKQWQLTTRNLNSKQLTNGRISSEWPRRGIVSNICANNDTQSSRTAKQIHPLAISSQFRIQTKIASQTFWIPKELPILQLMTIFVNSILNKNAILCTLSHHKQDNLEINFRVIGMH